MNKKIIMTMALALLTTAPSALYAMEEADRPLLAPEADAEMENIAIPRVSIVTDGELYSSRTNHDQSGPMEYTEQDFRSGERLPLELNISRFINAVTTDDQSEEGFLYRDLAEKVGGLQSALERKVQEARDSHYPLLQSIILEDAVIFSETPTGDAAVLVSDASFPDANAIASAFESLPSEMKRTFSTENLARFFKPKDPGTTAEAYTYGALSNAFAAHQIRDKIDAHGKATSLADKKVIRDAMDPLVRKDWNAIMQQRAENMGSESYQQRRTIRQQAKRSSQEAERRVRELEQQLIEKNIEIGRLNDQIRDALPQPGKLPVLSGDRQQPDARGSDANLSSQPTASAQRPTRRRAPQTTTTTITAPNQEQDSATQTTTATITAPSQDQPAPATSSARPTRRR